MVRDRGHVGVSVEGQQAREVGHGTGPRDQHAHEHGDADPQADEVSDRQQGQREADVDPRSRIGVATESEVAQHVGGEELRRDDHLEHRRDDAAPDDGEQAGAVLRRRAFSPGADLEHLGAGHALGVGQVGRRHERAAQRDRVGHAEHATHRADDDARDVGEAAPPADHHQAGQHEDDGGDRAGRRGHGLHDVVLLDGHAARIAQQAHGDDRRRDRRGESQARLEAEVDVGCREQHRDQQAEHDAAQGQLVVGGGDCFQRNSSGSRRESSLKWDMPGTGTTRSLEANPGRRRSTRRS